MEEKEVLKGMGTGEIAPVGADKDGAMYFLAETIGDSGSAPSDEVSEITETTDDRSVRMHINRDDDGCVWAFENDAVVYRNVMRLCAILNNGYKVIKIKKNDRAEEARKFIEDKLTEFKIREKYNSIIINRTVIGWAPVKKMLEYTSRDLPPIISGLLELEPMECYPIRNLATGELGGKLGKGLDSDKEKKEIALVQKGTTVTYTPDGTAHYAPKNFYFGREEIMFFTLNERGKFKAVSPVRRVLRLIEAKKTLENIVELVCRRYGPQIWVVVGNKDVNFKNVKIPQSYFRGGVDQKTAMENYRNDIFSSLSTKIKQWSTGETLAMMAEYGISVDVINPSANLPRYIEFIQMYADFIKNAIFGLDFPGRVDVTSSRMLERLPRDLEDALSLRRDQDFDIINMELINPLLVKEGYAKDSVRIEGEPLDRLAIEREVEIEKLKSAAVFNYARSGFDRLPKHLKEKWDFDIPDLIKGDTSAKSPGGMSKDEQHPPIGPKPGAPERAKGAPGPIENTSR